MSPAVQIRLAVPEDAEALLDIYAPFVLDTAVSFETEVPDLNTFQSRIIEYGSKAPWLVAEDSGEILGYAYATGHRSRGAYRWTQEVTVYVHPNHRKKGIARALYTQLLDCLKVLGYTQALGIITLPNEASIQFHKSLGFHHIGDMEKIGYKLGRWHTTSWWALQLQADDFVPGELKPVEAIIPLLNV